MEEGSFGFKLQFEIDDKSRTRLGIFLRGGLGLLGWCQT